VKSYSGVSLSILVSAYNSASSIRQTLQSVPLNDSRLEVIVIDDGSTDETRSILEVFTREHPLTKVLIESTKNLGSANARNRAINLASGEWLIFLDSDDQLNETTVRYFLDHLSANNHYAGFRFAFETAKVGVVVENSDESVMNLMHEKAFWRYIYRKQFLIDQNLHFFPTFNQAGGFYVLDDWYFLLTFLSLHPEIALSNCVLYKYNNLQRTSSEEVSRYVRQIELEHNAFKTLRKVIFEKSNSDFNFLISVLYSRVYMICKLLNPSPSTSAKLRLVQSFGRLLLKCERGFLKQYGSRVIFLWIRVVGMHLSRFPSRIRGKLHGNV
jgi:glycosyltransferase involved in cell wall biosynthesis